LSQIGYNPTLIQVIKWDDMDITWEAPKKIEVPKKIRKWLFWK
jgi:hypothetical protein